jgi:rhodanese-related sulfurtransferase
MILDIKAGGLKKSIVDGEKMRLIDVREVEEFEKAHIENSESIPVTVFKEKYQELLPDKDEKIVLICRSGGRSMILSIFLEGEGYTNIANFEGGVVSWSESGLQLTPTNEILPSGLKAMPDFF